MALMAGILDRNTEVEFGGGRQIIEAGGEPFVNVVHPGAEGFGFRCVEQVAVLLHRGAAAGRVDEDRPVVGRERRDRRFRSFPGRTAESSVGVEGAAARRKVARGGHTDAGGFEHPLAGIVDVALPDVHDATREEIDVVARGVALTPSEGQVGGHAEPFGNESQSCGDGQQTACEPQNARPAQRPEGEPLATGGDGTLVGEHGSGRFDETAVGNAARTRRLTSAALHAGVERVDDLRSDGSSVVLNLAHEVDTAPWREGLVARDAVGGAVGEAEPALHACVEVVGVDPEIHVRLLPGVRGSVARRDRTVASSVRRSGRQRGRARWVRVVLRPRPFRRRCSR